jgi:hypothetical protein
VTALRPRRKATRTTTKMDRSIELSPPVPNMMWRWNIFANGLVINVPLAANCTGPLMVIDRRNTKINNFAPRSLTTADNDDEIDRFEDHLCYRFFLLHSLAIAGSTDESMGALSQWL